MSRTVNSPVSLSMLTWVTCIGFVGVEMVGRRGEPSLKNCEKVDFFFALEASAPSPDQRCRGELVPVPMPVPAPPSERGGVMVSILRKAE